MDGADLIDRVSADASMQLSRLGSDKYLIAATHADLAAEPVLRSVAETAASGRETFERWADEAEGEAAAAFATAAETEADHYERVVTQLEVIAEGDARPGLDDRDAVHDALTRTEGTPERVGAGLVGRSLVADRALLQVVSFFVNEGDEERADLFRSLRVDFDERIDGSAGALDAVCTGGDYERARAAAREVIDRAYVQYADALEAMDVDPKPVC